jgi:hypothetical protein
MAVVSSHTSREMKWMEGKSILDFKAWYSNWIPLGLRGNIVI